MPTTMEQDQLKNQENAFKSNSSIYIEGVSGGQTTQNRSKTNEDAPGGLKKNEESKSEVPNPANKKDAPRSHKKRKNRSKVPTAAYKEDASGDYKRRESESKIISFEGKDDASGSQKESDGNPKFPVPADANIYNRSDFFDDSTFLKIPTTVIKGDASGSKKTTEDCPPWWSWQCHDRLQWVSKVAAVKGNLKMVFDSWSEFDDECPEKGKISLYFIERWFQVSECGLSIDDMKKFLKPVKVSLNFREFMDVLNLVTVVKKKEKFIIEEKLQNTLPRSFYRGF